MTAPSPALMPFADGVWIDTAPARVVGMRLSATMAVLRLAGDELLLFSPLAMTPERRSAIDALGSIAHLYAPNLYHHLHVGQWAAAYPRARLHAPAGLATKRPDLRIDRVCGSGEETAFVDHLDEVCIAGFRLAETVLVHRRSRTLVVADLVHNIGRPQHWWAKVYAGAMGFYDRVALSGMIRLAGFSDRSAARASLDILLALPFDRIVVGHGAPIGQGAKAALETAYAFLPARRPT